MSFLQYNRGDSTPLSDNFVRKEFDCKCGECEETLHDEKLSEGLQRIRHRFGETIITSGYRCKKHNTNVGGSSDSYHMKGMAADFIIPGVNVSEICKFAESIGFYGIGMYDDGYVHVDTRPESHKAFWRNSDQIPVDTFGGSPEDMKSPDELADAIKKVLADFGY